MSGNWVVTVFALSCTVIVMVAAPALHAATFSVTDTLVLSMVNRLEVTNCGSLLTAVSTNWPSAVSGSVIVSGTVTGTLAVVVCGGIGAMVGANSTGVTVTLKLLLPFPNAVEATRPITVSPLTYGATSTKTVQLPLVPVVLTVARPGFELTAMRVMPGVEFDMVNAVVRVALALASATVRSAAPEITGGAPGPTFTVKLFVLKPTPSVATRLTVVIPTSPLGAKVKV